MLDHQPAIRPSIFAESMYMLQGKPFRLTQGRRYLLPIYDADISDILLKTGRQVEKSTTASTKIGNNVLLKPFSSTLYVAPLNEQVKTFSRARLDKLFRYSQKDLVRKRYMERDLSNQVFHKEFNNGAEIYLRNCYEEADNIRGLSIDDVLIDEIQDITMDALPVILETQTRSKNPHRLYTGTPKSLSNTIQQQWERSSQAEWVVRCPHCKTHQVLGVANVTPKGFICRAPRCQKPLPDIARAMGRWEHAKPNALLKGFRITQMMVPDISVSSLWNKIITYPKHRLYNEVLGLSYEEASRPFTKHLMEDITDWELGMYARAEREFANRPIFMGIDWGEGEKSGKQGTGYTVLFIGSYNENNKLQVLYTKRFEHGDELDPDYQIEFILKMVNLFRVDITVADYGAGQKENQRLRKVLKERFFQCHYVGRQKQPVVFEEMAFKYKIPRSFWITKFVEFVNAGTLLLPGKDTEKEIKYIHDNFTSVFSEYRHSQNGLSEELFYGHAQSEPDDSMHAAFYMWFASQLYKPVRTANQGRRGSIFRGAHGA